MSEIATVGLDRAKNVLQVHGAECTGRAVLRKVTSKNCPDRVAGAGRRGYSAAGA
jgi:hypothetical protein